MSRILIVDDNASNRKLLLVALRRDHELAEAETAEEALGRLAGWRPDLILLDLGLPGMSGLELARQLKADPQRRGIVLVAVTASAMKEDETAAYEAGFDGFLTKPLDIAALPAQLGRWLARGKLRVLVVDDDPGSRKALARTLEAQGHSVDEASDGVEALAALGSARYDAVVSDLLMPRLDGFSLTRSIRDRAELRDVAVVVYSATFSGKADMDLALDMGADAALPKPAPPQEIARALAEATLPGRPRRQPLPDERVVMREYNQVLIEKLEKTTLELRDLNERLEERVAERTGELEKALREVELLSSSISHDVRAPLRRIMGYAAMLRKEPLSEEGRENLERVLKNGDHMAYLIERLLGLSRLSRAEPRRVPVDLSATATAVLESLARQGGSRKWKVEPGLTAVGDPDLLEAALTNLLENAWKFTSENPEAFIEVGSSAPGVFYVRDNGAGFKPEHKGKLFVPFQRLHPSARFPGTGIGLASVARILERHGGRVWAEGEEGKGAAFYFSLPVTDA